MEDIKYKEPDLRCNILLDVIYFEKNKQLSKERILAIDKKLSLFRKFYDKIPYEFRKRLIELDTYITVQKTHIM